MYFFLQQEVCIFTVLCCFSSTNVIMPEDLRRKVLLCANKPRQRRFESSSWMKSHKEERSSGCSPTDRLKAGGGVEVWEEDWEATELEEEFKEKQKLKNRWLDEGSSFGLISYSCFSFVLFLLLNLVSCRWTFLSASCRDTNLNPPPLNAVGLSECETRASVSHSGQSFTLFYD